MYLLNGKRLHEGRGFTDANGVKRPAQWLRQASGEDKLAAGITEVTDPVRPDDLFYIVVDNGDGTVTSNPRDVAQVRRALVATLNAELKNQLNFTEWFFSRERDVPGKPVPNYVKNYRRDLRDTHEAIEATLTAAADIPALQAAWQGRAPWPQPPVELK